jgi:predicted dinucleotide-utilizing enzyme
MITDIFTHKTQILAQVEFEEAYDSAKFALEAALPEASQEVINELLSSLIDVVVCSLKNAIAESGESNASSH